MIFIGVFVRICACIQNILHFLHHMYGMCIFTILYSCLYIHYTYDIYFIILSYITHRYISYISTLYAMYIGMTVQGILPYYYARVLTDPSQSIKIDRCIYNTMADTAECMNKTLTDIKTVHFTVCQKPWVCERHRYYNSLCKQLHEQWFILRKEAEIFYKLPVITDPCISGKYSKMQLNKAKVPKSVFVSDNSPDRLRPIGETGYNSDRYD